MQRKVDFAQRDLIKEPLTKDELRALGERAGGLDKLVAPKRRADAEGKSGEALLAWLAADGKHVRRPIVEINGILTLGFARDAQDELAKLLQE